jgi:hypothetical protein
MATKDAMEAMELELLNGLKITDRLVKVSIHTKLSIKLALLTQEVTKFVELLRLQVVKKLNK